MDFDIEKHRIFECITGSRLYGTDTPKSDYDYRGVCIPPRKVLLDPFMGFDQKDKGFKEEDRSIYNLAKFMRLCADGNPNIVELLFVPDKNIILSSKKWEELISNREFFLSKKIRYTFSGYAFSQLEAIKRHRQWFLNPPTHKPTREEYGLTDKPKISFALITAMETLNKNILKEEYVKEFNKEKEYRKQKENWDHYSEWQKNRNPERKFLEEKYGYDLKHASHLFRLLYEGKELLLTGKITFPLPEKEEILAIKQKGIYSYDEVVEKAKEMDENFKLWYEESSLTHSSNKKKLTELYFNLIDS